MCGIFAYVAKVLRAEILEGAAKISHRGPDCTRVERVECGEMKVHLEYHRLAIMDTTEGANCIFHERGVYMLCNGEIYNFAHLISKYKLPVKSGSDCEVILHLYHHFRDCSFVQELSGDFAFVIIDTVDGVIYASRDRIGVRPLFYAITESSSELIFSSEGKGICSDKVQQVQPGMLYIGIIPSDGFERISFECESWAPSAPVTHFTSVGLPMTILRELLIQSVRMRLMADRPVGYLLSGGLDSSLIASIGASLTASPIVTFSIGFPDSPDLRAARVMAAHLKCVHHEVILTRETVLGAIDSVVYHNESYDITTTRASIPMYLLGKYIRENTDIKVVLSGEGSDEIFGGYLYFHKAPTLGEFQAETLRLIEELHMYDVLRADRSISAHGLELRVPFLDPDLLTFVLGLDPVYKAPRECGPQRRVMEKALLRDTFASYLPAEICYRQKEAFSDGIGYSSVAILKEHALNVTPKADNESWSVRFASPETPEAQMYYNIFCKYYHGRAGLYTRKYWMPKWCTGVNDPSATVLRDLHVADV